VLLTVEEYRDVVHIYNGYLLFDENRDYILRLEFLDYKFNEIRDERIDRCLDIKDDIKANFNDMVGLWTQEHKLRLEEHNKAKVSGVLIGLGSGVGGLVVGAALGIIISAVVVNK
jgi:hypothetical protein